MEQLSRHASQDEQIAYLYSLIREDPDFLQFFDRKQFSDTPLHSAAGHGRTWLALEIQKLMPSFGRKLNPDGFSPVDLALRQGHCETAMAMIKLNPDLVRVHGREGITPLHWATEMAVDVDILAGFLPSCPDSINELTNRGESVVHMAVKNGNVAAFVVLLGWLKRKGRKDVLGWRDWEGNTVLHLATSTNQSQVMELLVKQARGINDKNSKGLTALDIAMQLQTEPNGSALKILCRGGARRGSSTGGPKTVTYAAYLSSKTTIMERTIRLAAYLDTGLPGDVQNIILVVAVLIVTATYQAALSPPGGISTTPGPNNITSHIGLDIRTDPLVSVDGGGKVSMTKGNFVTYMTLYSIALAASLGTIFLLLPMRRHNILLHLSMLFLMLSYVVAIEVISPSAHAQGITWASYIIFAVIMSTKVVLALLRWKVQASTRLWGNNNFYT